ncbi:hypothetical protein EDC04DRAFT_2617152 [Pisolithus marmoratus]|nr:hypothetical protein EDC04DRAFT_2617152 [Pisolithus marmoratus]
MSQWPHRSKVNLHPGQIVLDSQTQRHTSEPKQANDEALQWAKEAEMATVQKAYEHVGVMESAMAARQAQDGTRPVKFVRPKPCQQSGGQHKGDMETKLGTAKEMDQEQLEIGLKAREKTILKLRSAIEQACKGVEAESSTENELGQEQLKMVPKPLQREKAILNLRKPHIISTCEGNINDERSGIEGHVKNWNELVLSQSKSPMPITFVSTIDADKPHRPTREIRPKHLVMCHQVWKSRLSVTPSVASESVPASDVPESETTQTSGGGSQFTNSDLPLLFLKGRKWAKNFLPTLLLWVGDQPDVWSIPKDDLVHASREIIKVIYPTFTALDDVRQHLSGWCHALGSTAIMFLDCYLASDLDTDVKWTYLDSSSLDKAFCGAFILQLLANAHLCSCAGSLDIPVLHLALKQYRARGTIALCVTALEHGIKLMKSKSTSCDATEKGKGSGNLLKASHKQKSGGRPANAECTFLEQNWGSTTSSYFWSVMNCESHVLQGIVRMPYMVLQDNSDGNSSMDDQIEDSLEGEIDAHTLMYHLAFILHFFYSS